MGSGPEKLKVLRGLQELPERIFFPDRRKELGFFSPLPTLTLFPSSVILMCLESQ